LSVVDDGSTDGTGDILAAAAAEAPTLLRATHPTNRGYGAALQTGVAQAAAAGLEYVLFMDSDLTNDPADIPRFVEHMAKGVDVIKASRYIPGGGREGVPRWRVAFSVAGNTVSRWLFRLPIHDYTNGFRAVKTELLRDVELRENGFAIIMEELYLLAPAATTYAEVPVILTNRAEGLRPSVFSYRPRSLWAFLKYPVMAATGRARRKGTTR
jgi:dolichol-phosphate mannosyltransferase